MTKALAYHVMVATTAVKSFIVQTPGKIMDGTRATAISVFTAVIVVSLCVCHWHPLAL
jgi:hypothetical protein